MSEWSGMMRCHSISNLMELIVECRNETLIQLAGKTIVCSKLDRERFAQNSNKKFSNLIPFIIPMSLRLTQNYLFGKFEHQPKLGIISAEWQYHEFVDNR